MDLWFDCGSINEEEYNRIYNLKKLLFDIFADHSAAPFKMDYISMVGGLHNVKHWIYLDSVTSLFCQLQELLF